VWWLRNAIRSVDATASVTFSLNKELTKQVIGLWEKDNKCGEEKHDQHLKMPALFGTYKAADVWVAS